LANSIITSSSFSNSCYATFSKTVRLRYTVGLESFWGADAAVVASRWCGARLLVRYRGAAKDSDIRELVAINFSSFYYRAMLCESAVFAVARRPSVSLSDMLVDCIHTAEDIVILFRPASAITLVFDL